MRARDQVVAAVLLAATTYFALHRIAEAKVDTAVGGAAFPLDAHRGPELEAFGRLRRVLVEMGEQAFADRLEKLRVDEALWVAPSLGEDRWAVYVEALRLVRRIYVRRVALLDPRSHIYPGQPAVVREGADRALAWITLAGALRHELAHYDGMIDEKDAYAVEIAWYEGVRASPWFAALQGEAARVQDWALTSAVVNARSAAARYER